MQGVRREEEETGGRGGHGRVERSRAREAAPSLPSNTRDLFSFYLFSQSFLQSAHCCGVSDLDLPDATCQSNRLSKNKVQHTPAESCHALFD